MISCSKDDCTNVSILQGFFVVNEDGEDLLNPKVFQPENFHVFYMDNKVKKELSYNILEFGDGRYGVDIVLNDVVSTNNLSYTYMQWNNHIDTITSTVYTKTKNDCYNHIVSMQKFNDSIWDKKDSFYTIIK